MNGLDWTVLVVLALHCVVGILRGFVRELFSLAAWLLAGLASWRWGKYVGRHWLPRELSPSLRAWGAGALVFVAVFLIVGLTGYAVRRILVTDYTRSLDHLLGGIVGLARGVLLLIVFFVVLGWTPLARTVAWRASRLRPALPTLPALRALATPLHRL